MYLSGVLIMIYNVVRTVRMPSQARTDAPVRAAGAALVEAA
jgi:hypothetical protein